MSASRLQRRAVAPAPERRGRSSVPKRTNSSPTFTCLSLDDSLVVSSPSTTGSPPSSPEDEVEQGYAMDLSRRRPSAPDAYPEAEGDTEREDEGQEGEEGGEEERGRRDDGEGASTGGRRTSVQRGDTLGLGLDVQPSIGSVLASPLPSFGRLSLGAPGLRLPGDRDRERVRMGNGTGVSTYSPARLCNGGGADGRWRWHGHGCGGRGRSRSRRARRCR